MRFFYLKYFHIGLWTKRKIVSVIFTLTNLEKYFSVSSEFNHWKMAIIKSCRRLGRNFSLFFGFFLTFDDNLMTSSWCFFISFNTSRRITSTFGYWSHCTQSRNYSQDLRKDTIYSAWQFRRTSRFVTCDRLTIFIQKPLVSQVK